MDGGKWKRWSDGEANCQSVELRKRGERKRLEMSVVMKTGGLICKKPGEVEINFVIDLKKKAPVVFHTERNTRFADLNRFF